MNILVFLVAFFYSLVNSRENRTKLKKRFNMNYKLRRKTTPQMYRLT